MGYGKEIYVMQVYQCSVVQNMDYKVQTSKQCQNISYNDLFRKKFHVPRYMLAADILLVEKVQMTSMLS